MPALAFSNVLAGVDAFRKRLKNLKDAEPSVGFPWYLYDTLANINHIKGIVPKDLEHIFTQPLKIADVGAADGDLAFYLESVGYTCDIYDYGPTNMNGLRGAREIKERLASKVNIFEGDIDSELRLKDTYDLIIFLGIIYHLKNPFHALEVFAKSSKYCLISTRTAKYFRDGGDQMNNVPAAYLLAPDEANNDATNFWIFTESGLRRIVDRAGWKIAKEVSLGDLKKSNPRDNNHDQRTFMFLVSKYFE